MKSVRYMCQLHFFGPNVLGEEDVIVEKKEKVGGVLQVVGQTVVDRIPTMVKPDMSDPTKRQEHDFMIKVIQKTREDNCFTKPHDIRAFLEVYSRHK